MQTLLSKKALLNSSIFIFQKTTASAMIVHMTNLWIWSMPMTAVKNMKNFVGKFVTKSKKKTKKKRIRVQMGQSFLMDTFRESKFQALRIAEMKLKLKLAVEASGRCLFQILFIKKQENIKWSVFSSLQNLSQWAKKLKLQILFLPL